MFKKAIALLLDFIYPRICVACETEGISQESYICIKCMMDLPFTYSHSRTIDHLENKLWGKIPVKQTLCFLSFTKSSQVQNILHTLKYKNKPELAEYLGKWYSSDLNSININEKIDFFIPIPIHSTKLKQRGYNQAEEFTKGLSEGTSIPMMNEVLTKKKATVSQTKTGSRYNRFINTSEVFEISGHDLVKGKRIGLVDDVLTTGATIEQAGKVLLDAGCKEIYVVAIAAAINA